MTPDDVLELLNRKPFEPFEIITSAGERPLVKHPEFAMVSPTRMVVMDPVADRLAFLALAHVTELRPVEAA